MGSGFEHETYAYKEFLKNSYWMTRRTIYWGDGTFNVWLVEDHTDDGYSVTTAQEALFDFLTNTAGWSVELADWREEGAATNWDESGVNASASNVPL